MSLRLKITVLLAVLAAAATAAIGVASYRSTTHELEETVDRSLREAARRFTDGRGEGFDFGFGDADGDGRPGDGARRPPSFEQVVWIVIDADGTVVDASGSTELAVTEADLRVAAGREDSRRRTAEVGDETYRVLTVALADGAVILARSMTESERITEHILGTTLVWVAVVIGAALVLGWLIARRMTRRLERLTVTAGTVAATGRLDVDVPVDGSDETGQLGRAFSGMLEALARSRSEQHQLVQDAGHELRTPLTSLRTNVSVLQRRIDALTPEQRAQLLADLDSETRELTDLVNELVQLATDQRNDEPAQPVRLGDVAERVAARARRRHSRDVTVRADGSTVAARPSAVERAVQNLVDNACKFAPDGPVEITVAAGTLTVRDHGPGLVDADIPHLFDRFFRSVEMRSKPGSGLGLSIVRSVAEAHGGRAFARNAPGGGAEIGISLPTDSPLPTPPALL